MAELKPYTNYHCPVGVAGDGHGHSSRWTGAHREIFRRPDDHLCDCGTELVETVEDGLYIVSWEMVSPGDLDYHPVNKEYRVKHEAEQHRSGLLRLADDGELIRNVQLASYKVTPHNATSNGERLPPEGQEAPVVHRARASYPGPSVPEPHPHNATKTGDVDE